MTASPTGFTTATNQSPSTCVSKPPPVETRPRLGSEPGSETVSEGGTVHYIEHDLTRGRLIAPKFIYYPFLMTHLIFHLTCRVLFRMRDTMRWERCEVDQSEPKRQAFLCAYLDSCSIKPKYTTTPSQCLSIPS